MASGEDVLGGPTSVAATLTFRELLRNQRYIEAAAMMERGLADPETIELKFLDDPEWSVSGAPLPVGFDTEIVIYVKTGTQPVDESNPAEVQAFRFTMRNSGTGWKVAGLNTG